MTIELDQSVAAFISLRPRLLRIAYRTLGSRTDAEDVVQEAWLRWQGAERAGVKNPSAFLTTTTSRLALNVAQSAWRRREHVASQWPAEPVDDTVRPDLEAEQADAVGTAILRLLERLTVTELVAYVLREAFDYPYLEIASIVHLREANTRQVVRRARQRIATGGRRQPVAAAAHRRVVQAFAAASNTGHVSALVDSLTRDLRAQAT
jgi:RNA polymerase sigma-70 factor (ECF subfamily)